MICPLCKGSGSLLSTVGGLKWWDCPCCGGAGVSIQHGPATLTRKPEKSK